MKFRFSPKATDSSVSPDTTPSPIAAKIRAYAELLKFRLSLLVAISAVFGYAMAIRMMHLDASLWEYVVVCIGALLVTGASNTLNQISERELDALMRRTQARPLPTSRLTVRESLVYALLLAVAGVALMGKMFNLPAALLSIIALLSYAFVYTPLKRITPFAVFVGAFPGALPPLIGWVAVTGKLDAEGLMIFAFQFFWQFPHFWAIAWLADEDYRKAGFKMLPSAAGKTKFSTTMILLYSLCLVALPVFPYLMHLTGDIATILLIVLGIGFAYPSIQLFRTFEDAAAKRLMFASFLYLPLIQLVFLFAS